MFTFDQSEVGTYHVQDLRAQAARDGEAHALAHASGGPLRRSRLLRRRSRPLAR